MGERGARAISSAKSAGGVRPARPAIAKMLEPDDDVYVHIIEEGRISSCAVLRGSQNDMHYRGGRSAARCDRV